MAVIVETSIITVSKRLAYTAKSTMGFGNPYVPEDIAREAMQAFIGTPGIIFIRQNTLGSAAYNYDYDHYESGLGRFIVSIHWSKIHWMIEKGEVLVEE